MAVQSVKTAREMVADIIIQAETKLPEGHPEALANSIVDGLRRRGFGIVDEDGIYDAPDELLTTLKAIRKRVKDAVQNEETAARDLASLSRRLQDVSQEIASLEERKRADAKSSGKSNNGRNGSAPRPSTDGSINI